MTTPTSDNNLLAQLAGLGGPGLGSAAIDSLAASEPRHDPPAQNSEGKLDALVDRIRALTASESSRVSSPASSSTPAVPVAATSVARDPSQSNSFVPQEPGSFRAAGLNDSLVESLALKHLLARGDSTGREVADQLKLPFILVDELLRGLKNEQLVGYRSGAPMNDYLYQLTDLGRERAKRYWSHCTYFGAAPVSLPDYIDSVTAQSLSKQQTTADHLRRAFSDLVLTPRMLDRLGPAVNSGRGLFLFGAAGNGKTSIAERVTRAFGQDIWIPRAIGIDGEIMRVFDPANHEELPLDACEGLYETRKIDRRWVRIRRPTLIVGGELTMSSLEVAMNESTGICEAPLQLKSNCGTLVIDDFGRQRMRIEDLLNRWIVPLERRYDFLNMPNGKKIEVPFDQLIIFSTNLEPREMVDEAFLRRIPYKIEVLDPSVEEFKGLFLSLAKKMGFPDRPGAVEHLIQKHYVSKGRPFRYCQPRDLLLQIRNFCSYKDCPLDITDDYIDMAVENYFAVM
jgi:predicted ATPase with chaperone activity